MASSPPAMRSIPPRPAPDVEGPAFRAPDWEWAGGERVGWWVRPGWRTALLGPRGLRIDEWRDSGRLATVKQSPQRVVYRVDLPEGQVYIKHFLVPSWREMLRQWFRRGKARNEGKRAARLAQIGVATFSPIALGEQRRRRFLFENYLITRAVPSAVPLDEFLDRQLGRFPEAGRARLRRVLARELALLTARLHDAGFLHRDFHPGNVLVGLDDSGRPWLAMIDLDALRTGRPPRRSEALTNLVHLNHSFWLRSSRADRLRFLRAYLDARSLPRSERREMSRIIEADTRAWAERLWTRWGRRCRGSNKYFKALHGRRTWAIAARTLDRGAVRALMVDPDAPFRAAGAVILKDSRTTTVAEVTMPVSGRPTRVIYKRFNRKKWLDPVLSLFRPSRAWRAWQAGQDIASRALPTPANLAVIARTGPEGLPRDTYLVTEKAEPSITLGDFLRDALPGLPAEERRRRARLLNERLAHLLRLMHARSIGHRDLKAANILLVGDPGEARFTLIDLVGAYLRHPMTPKLRVQNLARLWVSVARTPGRSRTDALRFLLAYLGPERARREGWKPWWRAIGAACAVKERRNRLRNRPLS